MPDPQSRADTLLGMLREWLTPQPIGKAPTVITAPDATVELPDVASPYPFKNPITPTKELDEYVRRIRSVVPGAGTMVREIQNQAPPVSIMKAAFREIPNYAAGNNLNETNIMGAISAPPSGGDKVYINPSYVADREGTLVHELTHDASYRHGEDAARSAEAAYAEYQGLQQALRDAALRARKK